MSEQPATTYLVKSFTNTISEEQPYADLAAATSHYEELERATYSDEGSPVHSAYLYAVTNGKRVMLRTYDRAYDEYLEWASAENFKCIYCGQRSQTDDTVGFYCYAGPRGEHRYERIAGDE